MGECPEGDSKELQWLGIQQAGLQTLWDFEYIISSPQASFPHLYDEINYSSRLLIYKELMHGRGGTYLSLCLANSETSANVKC